MCACLREETLTEGDKTDTRTVLQLPPALAPYKVAVFPLLKKDGLPEKAREIFNKLKLEFNCIYEEKAMRLASVTGASDAIGTPFLYYH